MAVSTTSRIACIPNSIGPHGSILRPAVFEEEHSSRAPFLLSLPFLLERRTVLELDPVRGLSVHFRKFNHKIALHLGPTGALRVPLHEFTPAMISHLRQGVQQANSGNGSAATGGDGSTPSLAPPHAAHHPDDPTGIDPPTQDVGHRQLVNGVVGEERFNQ